MVNRIARTVIVIRILFTVLIKDRQFFILFIKTRMSVFHKQPPEVFYKKKIRKIFAIFTGKHLCWNLFLIELQGFRSAALLKTDSNTGVLL